jgi:hypothetical protein
MNRGDAQASAAIVQKASVIDAIIEKVTPAVLIACLATATAGMGNPGGRKAQPSDHHFVVVDFELG